MSATTYYEVRGPRATYRGDDRVGTTKDVYLRFSCLSQRDAEAFATHVYQRESIVCTIDEIVRAT